MSTDTTNRTGITARYTLAALKLDDEMLMTGDTVHVEMTTRVDSVTHGTSWDGKPESTYHLVPDGEPQAALRVARKYPDLLGDAKAAIAEIESMGERLRDAEERAADLRRRNRHQAIAGIVVLVAIIVMVLTGCSTSTPTAEPSPSPAPAPTAPVQPEPAKAEPTFWDNYAPAVKERITKEIEAGDCEAMQGELDTAYNRDAGKNLDLIEFLNKAMQDGGCYN